MTPLRELCQAISACTKCSLAKGRTKAVPGEGPEDAELMFIGEGPGYNEDQQGRPFVGQAGKFLEQRLTSIGLNRNQVYICNVVKCRPPANRDPLPLEIETCRPWLDQQIEMINPKVIITLGRYSLARFFPNETISKIHGKVLKLDQRACIAMYHPAAALHQPNLRKAIEEDFKKIPEIIRGKQEPARMESRVEQLGFKL